jgi:hypothetical protein
VSRDGARQIEERAMLELKRRGSALLLDPAEGETQESAA